MMRSTEPAMASRVTINENALTTCKKTLVTSLGVFNLIHIVIGKKTVSGHCEGAWCFGAKRAQQEQTHKANGAPVVRKGNGLV